MRIQETIAVVTLLGALAGCVNQPARSTYDIVFDRFGPDAQERCERFAYQSGRNRYEFLTTVSGQAFAALSANAAASAAYDHCQSGRP